MGRATPATVKAVALALAVGLVTSAAGAQYNHATTSVGYSSSSDRRIHFGLGPATSIESLEIHWTSGTVQKLTNVKADQILTGKQMSFGEMPPSVRIFPRTLVRYSIK